jgi:hypothetical protein
MTMDEAKFYGLCIVRLKHQIGLARQKSEGRAVSDGSRSYLLESYCTGDIEEIIDILELYDIEDRSHAGLAEKLDELAFTASELVREKIHFGYTEKGELGIYVTLGRTESALSVSRAA